MILLGDSAVGKSKWVMTPCSLISCGHAHGQRWCHAGPRCSKTEALSISAISVLRLVERYLLDNYKPHQLSTYALTLYRHDHVDGDGRKIPIGEEDCDT